MTVVAQVTGALGTEGMRILRSNIQNDIHESSGESPGKVREMLADFGSHTDTFKDINKYNKYILMCGS